MKVTPMMLHFPAPIKVTATILRHPSPIHDTPFPRNNLSEDHGTSYPAPMQAIATILRVSLQIKVATFILDFAAKNTNGSHYTRFPRSIKSTI